MRLAVVRDLARRAGRAAVPVRGVEEVDAELVRPVHDRVCVRGLGQRTEVHGSEAQSADAQAGTAKMGIVHVTSLSCSQASGALTGVDAPAAPEISSVTRRTTLQDHGLGL